MTKMKYLLGSILLFLSTSSFAAIADWPYWYIFEGTQLSIAAGPSWSHAHDTSLVVSPFETDSVLVTNVTKGTVIKAGIGYHFFQERLKQRKFFNDLLVEFNISHNSETIHGDVWRYQNPAFNNFTFEAPVATTRAIIDVKPGLFTKDRATFYPIVGVGAAWSDVSYLEHVTASNTDPNSYHSLGTDTNVNISYDLGAGVRIALFKHISGSIEYIYTSLVDLTPASESTTNAALVSPPEFTLYNQSVLVGLNWEI
jgi:opacity protein-like surface antigen